MNTSGILIAVVGVFILVQVLRGNALQRLGIIPGSGTSGGAIEGGGQSEAGGAIEGGGIPITNPSGTLE